MRSIYDIFFLLLDQSTWMDEQRCSYCSMQWSIARQSVLRSINRHISPTEEMSDWTSYRILCDAFQFCFFTLDDCSFRKSSLSFNPSISNNDNRRINYKDNNTSHNLSLKIVFFPSSYFVAGVKILAIYTNRVNYAKRKNEQDKEKTFFLKMN